MTTLPMTMPEVSAVTESASRTLRRLDVTIVWMWSTEPVCRVDERHGLLQRLGVVSSSVERLTFRHEFEPDHDIDAGELADCRIELDDLAKQWFDPHDAGLHRAR